VGFRGELIYASFKGSEPAMPTNDELAIAHALHSKTIAVVGLSKDPAKASHDVASYLKSKGFRIVPINPTVDVVLGEKCYSSLLDLPDNLKREIEVVDIFRRAEDVPPIVDEAIQLHKEGGRPKVVWMQLGFVNEESARKAKEAGMDLVMDHCMKIEHARLVGQVF
jgi:predicted CoA-binding protein